MIRLTVKDTDRTKVTETALVLAEALRVAVGHQRVLGPEAPLIERLRNYYLKDIFIKIEKDKVNLMAVKARIKEIISKVWEDKSIRNSMLVIDVDPA